MIEVKFKKLHQDAVLPKYAHGPEEDAGMDLVACESVSLTQYQPCLVKVGLSVELPPYVEAQIRPRSGLALKHGVTVFNAPGTIDRGYRGELGVVLWWAPTLAQVSAHLESRSLSPVRFEYQINPGDRIAQVIFAQYLPIAPHFEEELSESARGVGGFGSTGK